MREIKEWTLGWTLADGFRAWLDENGFKTAELLGGYREYLKNNMLLQID